MVDLAETVERSRTNKELVKGLANAVAAIEKSQHKFRYAVLFRLSRIEAMLAQALTVELVQFWPPGRVIDAERRKLLREVDERVAKAKDELWWSMVAYIYGTADEPEVRRDGRRRWTGWEI